jgi:hypothetical protein
LLQQLMHQHITQAACCTVHRLAGGAQAAVFGVAGESTQLLKSVAVSACCSSHTLPRSVSSVPLFFRTSTTLPAPSNGLREYWEGEAAKYTSWLSCCAMLLLLTAVLLMPSAPFLAAECYVSRCA